MKLITPFDFVDMFPSSQRMMVVGNAPSLRRAGLGTWIDGHDVVVRFNECAILGHESDVGTRTDILVSHPYPEARKRPLVDGLTAPQVVVILAPQTRRGNKAAFFKWVGEIPVLFSYVPDLKGTSRERNDLSLTTGTYAISFLGRILQPREFSIAGFTMFLPGSTAHYWDEQTPSGAKVHSPHREAEIFIDILNGLNASVEVTADIAWVAQTARQKLRSSITVRSLLDWAPSES